MNNFDYKLNLIKQIYEYADKGYKLYRHYSMSDDINELKYQLTLLQHNEFIKFLLVSQYIHPQKVFPTI